MLANNSFSQIILNSPRFQMWTFSIYGKQAVDFSKISAKSNIVMGVLSTPLRFLTIQKLRANIIRP